MLDFSMNQLPLIGNFFENPAEKRMTGQMGLAAQNYQAYRPEYAQARLNALNQQMQAFRPVHNMLGQMYGPSAQADTRFMMQNPMSPRMMQLGGPQGMPVEGSPSQMKKGG